MNTKGCPVVDRLKNTNEDYITNLKKPRIPKDAAIEVYYTETPLGGQGSTFYKPQPGELKEYLLTMNVNHTGIGFRVISHGENIMEFVFNLRVNDFGIYILMPHINDNASSFKDLDWCNQVLLTYIPILDRKYWLKSDYICTINRDDFYALIDWIQGDYQEKRSAYIFLSVIKDVTRNDIFNPIRKSYLCDDFCYDVLRFLQEERNIAIMYYTVPSYNIAAFVTGGNPVKELDMNLRENQDLVYVYYTTIKKIFGDILNVVTVLRDKDSTPEEKAKVIEQLKEDILHAVGPGVKDYIDEFIRDILALGEDIMDIVSKLKIDPKDPEGKALIEAWEKFMNDKNMDNFYFFIGTLGYYITQKVSQSDLDKVKSDYNTLKKLLPKIMASFDKVIYYGYTDDYRLTYFLIEGPVGFYANYLETDLYRDLPVNDIYGREVSDDYTRINMDRRLIRNYIPKINWFLLLVVFIVIFIAIIIVVFLIKKKFRMEVSLG